MGIRLLIIEDNAAIRDALADALREEGYVVDTATDGGHGLARLSDGALPAVILLELVTLGMDGWEFRARQKADPRLSNIPIILLTPGGRLHDIALKLDFDACLSNPVDFDLLLEMVGYIVGRPKDAKPFRRRLA